MQSLLRVSLEGRIRKRNLRVNPEKINVAVFERVEWKCDICFHGKWRGRKT